MRFNVPFKVQKAAGGIIRCFFFPHSKNVGHVQELRLVVRFDVSEASGFYKKFSIYKRCAGLFHEIEQAGILIVFLSLIDQFLNNVL
ncbi:hypothetical protein ES703_51828 [subsurface metagenome]